MSLEWNHWGVLLTLSPKDVVSAEIASRHSHVQSSIRTSGSCVLGVPIRHNISFEVELVLQEIVHDAPILAGICAVDLVVAAT